MSGGHFQRASLGGPILASLLVAACAAGATGAPTVSPTRSPAVSGPSTLPRSPVEGVVTHVDSSGLTDVRGFTLRLADGTLIDFTIGVLENGVQFPPGHLTEHQAASEPIRVFFTMRDGVPVATRIEDASR